MAYKPFEENIIWRESIQLFNACRNITAHKQYNAGSALREELESAALQLGSAIAQSRERKCGRSMLDCVTEAYQAQIRVRSLLGFLSNLPQISGPEENIHRAKEHLATCGKLLWGLQEKLTSDGPPSHSDHPRESETSQEHRGDARSRPGGGPQRQGTGYRR